jgi:hypothetical protein
MIKNRRKLIFSSRQIKLVISKEVYVMNHANFKIMIEVDMEEKNISVLKF